MLQQSLDPAMNCVLRKPLRLSVIAGILALVSGMGILLSGGRWLNPPPLAVPNAIPVIQGPTAVEYLKLKGNYPSLAAAITALRYQITAATDGNYQATNLAHHLQAEFSNNSLCITSAGPVPAWQMNIQLIGVGYGASLTPLTSATLQVDNNRIVYQRQQTAAWGVQVIEWYQNAPQGLEQGFTLPAPPGANPGRAPVRLALAVSGDLIPRAAKNALTFRDAAGVPRLRYDQLAAWDASGRRLAAHLHLVGQTLWLEVNDQGATYPLTIDPLLTELTKLTLGGAADDQFGTSVALDGDTALIGVPNHKVDTHTKQGAAYVFVRDAATGVWSLQQELTAFTGAVDDTFGAAVALSGNTALIGAPGALGRQGLAYVFVRSGDAWSLQSQFAGSDGAAGDQFGAAVALSGDTALIGAPQHDVTTPSADQGAAYIFVRTGGVWNQQRLLIADDHAVNDQFGWSVALSGDTALVGALVHKVMGNTFQGAAYVFVRNPLTLAWSQQQQLIASDGAAGDLFGHAVALNGNSALIGAPLHDVAAPTADQGAAYVFVREGTTWTQQAQLLDIPTGAADDQFGWSVALNGNTALVGARGRGVAGAAYVYVRVGTTWSQQAQLNASDGTTADQQGYAVALSGNSALVGAPYQTVDANARQGAAYVFVRSGSAWSLQQPLVASDGAAGDLFGVSVALDTDTALVGAPFHKINANARQGAAYIFERSGSAWSLQQQLSAADGVANDLFGTAVAISGTTALISAEFGDGNVDNVGAVYVFARSPAGWSQQAKLTADDGASGNGFGDAVAFSGDTALIGAPFATVHGVIDQGAAYVFGRDPVALVWSQQQKLIASNDFLGHEFGKAVALDGDTALVGAYLDNVGGNARQGTVYVFGRTPSAVEWIFQQKLSASDGAVDDRFGYAVALSGNTALIGAVLHGAGADFERGAAYIFERTAGTESWTQRQQLRASDGAASDWFGYAVALDGATALVSAPTHNVGANTNQGAAYIFGRAATTGLWTQQQQLIASDGAPNDEFGNAVALAGATAFVGVAQADIGLNVEQGAAYVFAIPSFDLAVDTRTDVGGGAVSPGAWITYTFTFSTTGHSAHTTLWLTDTLSPDTSFVGPPSWACTAGVCTLAVSLSLTDTLRGAQFDTQQAGSNTHLIVQVNDPYLGASYLITNVVRIGSGGENGAEITGENNVYTTTTRINMPTPTSTPTGVARRQFLPLITR